MARKMYRHTRRPAARVIRGETRLHKLLDQNRMRLMCVIAVFAFSFTVLALRLMEVSLVGGGELPFKRLVSEPELMLQMDEKAVANVVSDNPDVHRRDIVDRNGVVLATNVQTASLVANPTLIREPQKVAQQLAAVLSDVPHSVLQERLAKSGSKFVYLKRHLTPGEQEKVNALGVPGLFFERHDRRVYPYGSLVSHVLGYVDIDNRGIAGVEKQFDKRLHQTGQYEQPLALSIDVRVQGIMEQELNAAMKKFSAIGATGVVVEISTGEILSMVSLPSFDPHRLDKATADQLFNRATLGAYEMGSSFKTFTVAMALNEGVVSMRDGYDAARPIQAAGFTINDSHPYYRWLSVPEIFAYSSNIGTVRMIQDVGIARQKKYLQKMGMFEPVNIELPERAQPLIPNDWREINSMTISYGHGISVSPLHLAQGIGSLINGGHKMKLSLLKSKKHSSTGERIISEQTSQQVRKLMRNVVEFGTAKKANVKGYQVGGKTGTAEKVKGGRYKDKAKLASLVAAFPMDDPKYLVFAMLDEPQGTKETYGYATGGWVAAPVVANVVSRMAPLLGMQPDWREPDPKEVQFWAESDRRNKEAHTRRYQARLTHAAVY